MMPELVGCSHNTFPFFVSNARNISRGAGKHKPAAGGQDRSQLADFANMCVHTRLPVSTFHAPYFSDGFGA